MSKRKGVSADEKKTRMLNIFYETKEVYNYKELEKAASEKGIVMQSVKDTLQSLIADEYVETDKIGTSVYYWAFPGKAIDARKRRLEELQARKLDSETKIKSTKESIASMLESRQDTDERRQLLAELDTLQGSKKQLVKEIARAADCDPDVIAAEKAEIKRAVEGVNRWTDNLESLRSWIKTKFNMSNEEVSSKVGIPDDLEYFDDEPKPDEGKA